MSTAGRNHPHVVVHRLSPNRSSRRGLAPRLIVIHSTESSNVPGAQDLANVADYLCRPATQASSHVIADADGFSARLVPDEQKAWHCAGYNGPSLGIEQIGRAAQTSWARDEIRETARWVARWSRDFDIPIRIGAVSSGSVTRSGVLRHMDLGRIGGGHNDPGEHYPLDAMLRLARFYLGKIT